MTAMFVLWLFVVIDTLFPSIPHTVNKLLPLHIAREHDVKVMELFFLDRVRRFVWLFRVTDKNAYGWLSARVEADSHILVVVRLVVPVHRIVKLNDCDDVEQTAVDVHRLVLDELLHGVVRFTDEAFVVVMMVAISRLVHIRRGVRMTHMRDSHAPRKVIESSVLPIPPGFRVIFVAIVGPAWPLLLEKNQPLVEMQEMDAAVRVSFLFVLGELFCLEVFVVQD